MTKSKEALCSPGDQKTITQQSRDRKSSLWPTCPQLRTYHITVSTMTTGLRVQQLSLTLTVNFLIQPPPRLPAVPDTPLMLMKKAPIRKPGPNLPVLDADHWFLTPSSTWLFYAERGVRPGYPEQSLPSRLLPPKKVFAAFFHLLGKGLSRQPHQFFINSSSIFHRILSLQFSLNVARG